MAQACWSGLSRSLDIEHPEWLLKTRPKPGGPDDPLRLLNLGNPHCRRWLTDHICNLVSANGIKIYRQDFNFPPLAYWRDNDAEDRQGMHENLHVQGYLQFWDELLSRNPGLWIDSCSSGGRRNDLETLRRSVPLHYTDYGYGNHPVKLAFLHTLYAWIPYFKECTLSWDVCQPGEDLRFDKQVDSYSFHCGMAPMMFATLDIRRENYDFSSAVKMIAIWRTAAETMLHGDYYPLTPFSKSAEKWVVRQFDVPENQHGFIQGIRLAECPEGCITVTPRGIVDNSLYVFENQETQQILKIPGAILAREGFTFTLPERSAAIWFYRKINKGVGVN
jgi:alpha-galactosidase